MTNVVVGGLLLMTGFWCMIGRDGSESPAHVTPRRLSRTNVRLDGERAVRGRYQGTATRPGSPGLTMRSTRTLSWSLERRLVQQEVVHPGRGVADGCLTDTHLKAREELSSSACALESADSIQTDERERS